MKPVGPGRARDPQLKQEPDVVLDPFGGSGSTLIACEKAGRQARLIGLDPRDCDVIIRRFHDFSGRVGVLETGSRHFEEVAHEREVA